MTNEIAKFIDKNEKENVKLREYVKDEFYPENENFLFKAESEDEELASVIEETIVIKEDDGSCEEEKNISEDTEEEGEEKKLREMFKSFTNKFSGKRKRSQEKPERKEKEKKEKPEREKATVVAPGENQPFDNDFKYQEEKCFPTLFPMGGGGYASSYLETGLGFSNYCKLRLTGGICVTDKDMYEKIKNIEKNSCIDYELFRRDHHYMMFLLLVLDAINMRRAQNTAFRKVTRFRKYTVDNTRIKEEDRASLERRNIGYRTFKNIRGTAPYFEHQKSRLFAFLRQKGPPTIFTTITSAEYDWISLMENIIKAKPDANRIEDFINTLKNRNNLSHLLNLENKEDLRNHAGEIIKNMEGAEMSKLVNDHIVHTTKDFDERLKHLFRLFKLPGFFEKEMKYEISDYFIRIEHQQRGAPHGHILLWMVHANTYIEKTVFINGEETIIKEKKAAPNFKNSVAGKKGQAREEGIQVLENFADELITLKIMEDEENISKYQTHKHTFTCTKGRKMKYIIVKETEGFGQFDGKMKGPVLKTPKCRFHFPRFPIRKTTFLEPLIKNDNNENIILKADINLNRIRKFMLRNLFQENVGESDMREEFLKLSYDAFLKKIGITEEDYTYALRRSAKGHGSLFMKRDCSQVFINNFNRNIMNQHSANQDFTLCIDENQVAAYVINYLTKNEAGQSKMLREVDEQCAKEGISYSEKLKKFAQALDQSREVSVQVYKHKWI